MLKWPLCLEMQAEVVLTPPPKSELRGELVEQSVGRHGEVILLIIVVPDCHNPAGSSRGSLTQNKPAKVFQNLRIHAQQGFQFYVMGITVYTNEMKKTGFGCDAIKHARPHCMD